MRPNLKLFPDTEAAVSRADRFVSEMNVHKSLDEARAAIAQRERARIEAREARRARLGLMEG